MRLINTTTYEVKEFSNNLRPSEYAILSHVWGDEEITFADMLDLKQARKRKGWSKLERFCYIAAQDGFQWVWDDTCCINKSSSAEFSHAINSMYAWYSEAKVCYAYLQDVPDLSKEDPTAEASSFRGSRWFTRGWTLQELIAPKVILFMSKNWKQIGTKLSLAETIRSITNVDEAILAHERFLDDVSVARRMSWASGRETTLVEDRAYSLMGIFGVNMPMIYGEGEKAFIRLQLEIMRQTPDQSIFAWGTLHDYQVFKDNANSLSDYNEWADPFRCILASSPKLFAGCEYIEPVLLEEFNTRLGVSIDFPESSPTNYGIQLHLPTYTFAPNQRSCFALLACKDARTDNIVALLLRRVKGSSNRYYVGMHLLNRPLTKPWHPYFRSFSLPFSRSEDAASSLRVTRVYLHSHNVNPQRSQAEGFANRQLLLRSPQPRYIGPPRRFAFTFPGWLMERLSGAGLRTAGWKDEKAEAAGHVGWTPMKRWRQHEQALTVTFDMFPPSKDSNITRHAVILIRGSGNNVKAQACAFAIVIGVLEPATVWCEVLIKGPSTSEINWERTSDHEVAKSIWHGFDAVARDLERPRKRAIDGAQWENHARIFADGAAGKVKIEFSPWFTQGEVSAVGNLMTYTVRLWVDMRDVKLWESSEQEKVEHLSGLSCIVAHT
ncbi:heterokaryon incompatibility protein-domain-containing protein [Earliella scabrosa]|nr:heterokaryon incompatibility protein-domain-containing protein [Earliella scabrosa]